MARKEKNEAPANAPRRVVNTAPVIAPRRARGAYPTLLKGGPYIRVFATPDGRVKARSKRGWTEKKVPA